MKCSVAEVAVAKLAARNMTVEELRRYLLDKAYSPEEIAPALKVFCEDGYLDDGRFCRAYFVYAFSKNKAKARIFAELRRKGVEDQVILESYDQFLREEEFVGEEILAKREVEKILCSEGLTMEDPVPEKLRGRIARKLHSYGYRSSLIYELLEEMK